LLITLNGIFTQKPPSSNAFSQVKNLLVNFKNGITKEQSDADTRHEKDTKWCTAEIQKATELVASRQKDVDDLEDHIEYLKKTKIENEKDKKTREDRIVSNKKLLEDFKKQRCDNNLVFVKQLREHMEGIDVMKLLKKDIIEYFANKKKTVQTSFIERFSEFSHLLNEEHKQIFVELSQSINGLVDTKPLIAKNQASTAHEQRTGDQVGDEHIDNTKGELKKLEHVAHESVDVYTDKLSKKVITMIDNLINHLEDSKEELTKNEIQAAEDFAVFQSNMGKENERLEAKIQELIKVIADLTQQIQVAEAELEKRKELLQNAKDQLEAVKTRCEEKKKYYESETERRNGELSTVDSATQIFNNIVDNLSSRVRTRTNNLSAGKDVGEHVIKAVKSDEDKINTDVEKRQDKRNDVVFVQA
jgi:hypothetical protein